MAKLKGLAEKVAAARDRLEDWEREQTRLLKQYAAPDRGKFRSDEAFRSEFAYLEKQIQVAQRELAFSEGSLISFAERQTSSLEEAAKMARDAVSAVDEERDRSLRRAAGFAEPTDSSQAMQSKDGALAATASDPEKTVDDARRELREALLKAGVLPSEDWRKLDEDKEKALEAGREAERQRRLERGRDGRELELPDPDLEGR